MDVIVDVDTGVDDALAILFLARHPGVRIHAVTCVAGNTTVEQATRNTLSILHSVGGVDVPVGVGATRPLIEPPRTAAGFHGVDGLGGIVLPTSPQVSTEMHAVELMRRTVAESAAPMTLLALGPLTNIALFVRMYPEVVAKLERIVFMGGSATVGNATPVAEFNAWHDPEAVDIVLAAPTSVVMYGLDVFNKARIPVSDYTSLCESTDSIERLVGVLLRHSDPSSATPDHSLGGLLGDAGAACFAVDPSLVDVETLPTSVELSQGLSRGQTIVDRRLTYGELEEHGGGGQSQLVGVALKVDCARMARLFMNTIRKVDNE